MKQKQTLSFLTPYILRYKGLLLLAILLSFIFAISKILGMLIAGQVLMDIFIGQNFENVNLLSLSLLFLFGFFWTGSLYVMHLCSHFIAIKIIHDIRQDLYKTLISLPIDFYKTEKTGNILSIVLNDVSTIEIFLMNVLVQLIAEPLTVVLIVICLIWINPVLSIYFFAITPILALAIGLVGMLVQKLSQKVQTQVANITSFFQESIEGIEVIKGFAIENQMKSTFAEKNDTYQRFSQSEAKVRLLGLPTSSFLGIVALIIIIGLGSHSIKSGLSTVDEVINYILLALVLSQPLSISGYLIMVLKKLGPATIRIDKIIHSSYSTKSKNKEKIDFNGKIDFNHVSFSYSDNKVNTLKDIDLHIKSKETIAIVGHSGAGKSTLVSLLEGFYLPQEGSLLFEDKDASLLDLHDLRKKISVLSQNIFLFSGTIRENLIIVNPKASEKDITYALEKAFCIDFIKRLPNGIDTIIGSEGNHLSGGEKQRIAFARAILRKPKLLILDEPTSSLDAYSEQKIHDTLKNILGVQTTIIVTHKLSTISYSDRIVLLNHGQIEAIGSHKQLSQGENMYSKLLNIELNL